MKGVVKNVVHHLDHVDGLDGLGTHLSNNILAVSTVYTAGTRIEDPQYAQEPVAQQIGCGAWGTAIQFTGDVVGGTLASLVPYAGPVLAAGVSVAAAHAGDHAQQNCHDVINMFKPDPQPGS